MDSIKRITYRKRHAVVSWLSQTLKLCFKKIDYPDVSGVTRQS